MANSLLKSGQAPSLPFICFSHVAVFVESKEIVFFFTSICLQEPCLEVRAVLFKNYSLLMLHVLSLCRSKCFCETCKKWQCLFVVLVLGIPAEKHLTLMKFLLRFLFKVSCFFVKVKLIAFTVMLWKKDLLFCIVVLTTVRLSCFCEVIGRR